MSPKARKTESWEALNQRHLAAELDVLRAALEAHITGTPLAELPEIAGPRMDTPPAAEQLARAFRLSRFERSLLVACAGAEMDAGFAALCARAQGLTGRATPTFSLALAALPGAHWSALAPAAPLRQWQLIEAAPADSVVYGALRVSERVLHYLLGVQSIDERLMDHVAPVAAPLELPKSLQQIAARAASIWSRGREQGEYPVLVLCGREAPSKREIAAAAAATLGVSVYAMRAAAIPAQPQDAARVLRLWEREAVLSAAALLIECDDLDKAESARTAAFADDLRGLVILSARDPLPLGRRTAVRLDVAKPTRAEQIELWRASLGAAAERLGERLRPVVSQFHFSRETIRSVALAARTVPGDQAEPALWRAAVEQSRPRMGELAERIEARANWDDLVLPDSLKRTMREILLHVRHRPTVQEEWGFETKSARGMGLGVLFSGPPGTGKTMAAEVMAGELEMDLYRIDLSAVVSKYIGETEKNLRRVFDAAEDGGVVLLFDEADALFGKRSEVKDSHDRYANIEVSYLLQRMEAFRGLAILTTNMKSALDTAFTRRLRFVLDFPFPGTAEREAIWRHVFPEGTPLGSIDWKKLARLNVSGASIRNMAMGAAFRAADDGRKVEMRHLLEAAESEYLKLERPLATREVEDWV